MGIRLGREAVGSMRYARLGSAGVSWVAASAALRRARTLVAILSVGLLFAVIGVAEGATATTVRVSLGTDRGQANGPGIGFSADVGDGGGWLDAVQVSTSEFATFSMRADLVAVDGSGRITVAWVSVDPDSGEWLVLARRSNSAGAWGPTELVGIAEDPTYVRAVVSDVAGTVTIVYAVVGDPHGLRARQWADDGAWDPLHAFRTSAQGVVAGVGPDGQVVVLARGRRTAYVLEDGTWLTTVLPGRRPRGGKQALVWGPAGHPTAVWWSPVSDLVKSSGYVPATATWADPRRIGKLTRVYSLEADSNGDGAAVVATTTVEDSTVVLRTAHRAPGGDWTRLAALRRLGQSLTPVGVTVDASRHADLAWTADSTSGPNRSLTLAESDNLGATWSAPHVVLDNVYVLVEVAGNDHGDLALATTRSQTPAGTGATVVRRGANDADFAAPRQVVPDGDATLGPIDINASGEVAATAYLQRQVWETSYLLP
jgi:hypothetical protein